jgi:hypothetical protein
MNNQVAGEINLPDELMDNFVKCSQVHAELVARLDEHINHSHCVQCSIGQPCDRREELSKQQLENGRSGAEIMNKCMEIWLTKTPLPGLSH